MAATLWTCHCGAEVEPLRTCVRCAFTRLGIHEPGHFCNLRNSSVVWAQNENPPIVCSRSSFGLRSMPVIQTVDKNEEQRRRKRAERFGLKSPAVEEPKERYGERVWLPPLACQLFPEVPGFTTFHDVFAADRSSRILCTVEIEMASAAHTPTLLPVKVITSSSTTS